MDREEMMEKMENAACEACRILDGEISKFSGDHFPDICDADSGEMDHETVVRASLEMLAQAPFLDPDARKRLSDDADSLYRDMEREAKSEIRHKRFKCEEDYWDAVHDGVHEQLDNLDREDFCARLSCIPADEGDGFRLTLSLIHEGKALDSHSASFSDAKIARCGEEDLGKIFADSVMERFGGKPAPRSSRKGARP